MSTKTVVLEQIEVLEHTNADNLELAKVGEYRSVIPKDRYKSGDWALYIPEGVILPDDLIEELGLTGKLAGPNKDRVKAIRLRGELSQGIVCMPQIVIDKIMVENKGVDFESYEGYDWSNDLNIIPWSPPIPTSMDGEVDPAPQLVKWGDIENIKRFPRMFVDGENVIVTEKIHGTCFCSTYDVETDTFMVSSKGLAKKNLALKEDKDRNIYWKMARHHKIEELARTLAAGIGSNIKSISIFGEVYGKGIQDLHYHQAHPTLALFDIRVIGKHLSNGHIVNYWLPYDMLSDIVEANALDGYTNETDLQIVPLIYQGPYDYQGINGLAEELGSIAADNTNILEGLVVRANPERYSDITGSRTIAKFINPEYLTRTGNATEYE